MRGNDFFLRIASQPPFSRLHPSVAQFFKDYLTYEKIIEFDHQYVLNTHFPPFPSLAFDRMVEQFNAIGEVEERHLYSLTLAVTNRCNYKCWHCYNAGRSEDDLPLRVLRDIINQLKKLGVVMITLTGGEPLLRSDLEEIACCFGPRICINLNTTGSGLTSERATALKQAGVFGVGVSLDSMDEGEHDRLRGMKGAFRTALNAIEIAGDAGLYPYIIAVYPKKFDQKDHFMQFMSFAGSIGSREVHLLEPSASGRLAGQSDVLLRKTDKERIIEYQKELSTREDLPILSSFTYLESPQAFGCGAGLTHMYIDGSGEVSPCNLVPLSFGNAAQEPFETILERMGQYFVKPRVACVGHTLARHITSDVIPTPPDVSVCICEKYLSKSHKVPRFFEIRSAAKGDVGQEELQSAYNRIHSFYDEFWVCEAGKPIVEIIEQLQLKGDERIFEAGCGTGFATEILASKVRKGSVMAVDLSRGMLDEAERRLQEAGSENVHFQEGDALQFLAKDKKYDLIFTSWVLGYIPLESFFSTAVRALKKKGRIALIVHKENSPKEPLEIFFELVARDPSVLEKRVQFGFPLDLDHLKREILKYDFTIDHLSDHTITFTYENGEQVLEHLLKSGAGTAFHDAINIEFRKTLEQEFITMITLRNKNKKNIRVTHDYIVCVASKGRISPR